MMDGINTDRITWRGSHTGLANRLIGLACALVISKLSKKKLYIRWINNAACPCNYSDLFETPVNLLDSDEEIKYDLKSAGWSPDAFWEESFNKFIHVSKSKYFELVRQELKNLRLKKHIELEIKDFANANFVQNTAGVHIRRTDKMPDHKKRFWSGNRRKILHNFKILGLTNAFMYSFCSMKTIVAINNKKILREVRRLQKYRNINHFFIASDNKESQDILSSKIANLGGKVVFLDKKYSPHKLRKTSVKDALIDMYLLSKCRYILANVPTSTFTLIASIIGDVEIKLNKTRHTLGKY